MDSCLKCIFIFNPESGKGKIKKYLNFILDSLTKKYHNVELLQTTHQNHAFEFLKENGENYDYIFVSGGDGTLNEIVNAISNFEKKPIVGYIPTGTVNDVARSLSISQKIKKAVKVLTDGKVFEHDIFKINEHYGTYVCCTGLFSVSSYKTPRNKKKKFGKISYFFNGITELIKAKPIKSEIQIENKNIDLDASLILISNSKSTASFRFNKKAILDDGKVDLFIFKSHKNHIMLSEILRVLSAFLFGINHLKKSKQIIYRQISSFNANFSSSTPINIDGEKALEGSFSFTVIPKGLKILVPKK